MATGPGQIPTAADLTAAGYTQDANGNWIAPAAPTSQTSATPPSADNPFGQAASAPTIAGVTQTDPNASLPDQYAQAAAEYAANPALQNYINQTYGYVTWMMDIPELRNILITAAVDNWDGGRVTGALNKTDWWKNNGQAARDFQQKAGTDPATVKEMLDQSRAGIQEKAASLGVQLTDDQLSQLALNSATYQWNADQIDINVRKMYDMQTTQGPAIGDAAAMEGVIKQAGAAWLQPMDANAVKFWTDSAMSKGQTSAQLKDDMNVVFGQQAAQRYPWMKAAIDSGMTAQDYLSPYTSQAAKTLSISPDSITWSDPKWMGALLQQNPDGTSAPVNADQFNKNLMKDAQFGYQHTQGAIDQAFATAKTIEQTFGKVG